MQSKLFTTHTFPAKHLGVCGYIVTKYKMVAVILFAKHYKYCILLRFIYAKMWIGIWRSLGFIKKQFQHLYIFFLPVLSFIMLWSVALSLVLSSEKWPRSLQMLDACRDQSEIQIYFGLKEAQDQGTISQVNLVCVCHDRLYVCTVWHMALKRSGGTKEAMGQSRED